ncbi:hypothetical protein K8R66_01010 [bacterium]|nr:hypothetical protein [bacterium]
MLEKQPKVKGNYNFFYYIFKLFINLAGIFCGIALALTLFYPLMLAFPNNFLIVFLELYLILLLAIISAQIFNIAFENYVNYKALFHHLGLKIIFSKKNFLLAFYYFGLLIFAFFIWGLF